MATQNRRKHRRASARGIAAHLKTDHGLTPCLVENLSSGGLFIRTARLMPVGMAVAVNLVRPGMKKALWLTGRIANSAPGRSASGQSMPPGMGIAFDPLQEDTGEHLAKLLRELGLEPAEGHSGAASKAAPEKPAETQDSARLLVQIRSVLTELGEAQAKLDSNEKEIAHLKADNEKLRAQLRDCGARPAKTLVSR